MRRATLTALVGALLLVPAARAADEPAKTPLTAELLWQVKRLAAPAVSPDGQWAVVPVTTWDVKEDKALTDLWLLKTDGSESRALTTHEGSETSPAWSPDGKWIAFEAKREGDENGQIYLLPLGGGEARRLTKVPTGASAPKWFADSRRVAFISRVWPDLASWDEQAKRQKERKDSKMTARTFDKAEIRYWDHWLDDRQAHVYSIGIEGGEPRAVTLGTGLELSRAEAGASSYDIAPDGTEVAFAADSDATGIDSNFDVYVVPVEGGKARNLTPENPAGDGSPAYSPDGRFIAFGRQVVKGFYADRTRLVLHDRAASTNRVLTEAWDRSVGTLAWTPDSKALVGAIDDAGHGRVYRIDAATGAPAPLTKAHTFSGLALSRDGRTLVALREGFSEPPTLVRVDLASGEPTKLSTFNDELLARVAWGRYESVTYKGSGGKDIQMWVVYPPGLRPREEVPALPDPPRRAPQRRPGRLHVPLERAGLLGLGLRLRLAQLPRLVGLRSGLRRLDQPRLGDEALRGHDRRRGLVRPTALDRPRAHDRRRRQLRRLPGLARPRAAAPLQGAGRARRRLQPLHAVRCGLRRGEEALRRVLGARGRTRSTGRSRRTSGRRTSRRRPSSSTGPSTTACPTTTASSSSTPCRTAACAAASSTTPTRTTGS